MTIKHISSNVVKSRTERSHLAIKFRGPREELMELRMKDLAMKMAPSNGYDSEGDRGSENYPVSGNENDYFSDTAEFIRVFKFYDELA